MLCADWHRGVLVHAWYIIPEKDVFRSRDLFKFWEISDDISEMVQHRDIVAAEE